MSCNTLRAIRPGPQEWGSRRCSWFPIEHSTPATHSTVIDGAACGGIVSEVDVYADGRPLYACELCESVVEESEIRPRRPCDGHKRAIK